MKTLFTQSDARFVLSLALEIATDQAAQAGVELESATGSAIYDDVIESTLAKFAPTVTMDEFYCLLSRPDVLH
ncbi:hypothetical protein [Paraburkholderia acidisoli]|uniref:Uncharacterized protein n=1 Tax=Paraburkholderia acidisoli TaxID=2571748 RepID=A0A7Z2JG94_9BURK|nr:hypothetical protein [Paraburkholderia acidisoli]QGZ64327.1 hypothetical protein FAZ98_21645 [Paraburkholderia acidisoli]